LPSLEPVTVIVPTFNERENLPVLAERLARALGEAGRPFELVVVDDDSPDGTAELAGELAGQLGAQVRAVVRRGERGLATAVIRGLREARYDLCLCMDADLSHPPELVPELVARVEAGAPFVLGSRYVEGGETRDWAWWRWLNSAGATLLARPLTPVRDPMSGFFCCRRSEVPLTRLDPVGYKIALEILVKSGLPPVEVPITFTDRLAGRSKLTLRQQLDYLVHLARLYRWRWPGLVELALFCAVGSVGMAVDLAVITALVEGAGVWFGYARLAGFLAAVSLNFALNDSLTFRGPGKVALPRRYLRFLLTSSAGGAVNYAVSLALFLGLAPLQRLYWLAAVAGVLCGTTLNFLGAKRYAFRRTP
jgi:dolichol-phosphate mannosyltransferase